MELAAEQKVALWQKWSFDFPLGEPSSSPIIWGYGKYGISLLSWQAGPSPCGQKARFPELKSSASWEPKREMRNISESFIRGRFRASLSGVLFRYEFVMTGRAHLLHHKYNVDSARSSTARFLTTSWSLICLALGTIFINAIEDFTLHFRNIIK